MRSFVIIFSILLVLFSLHQAQARIIHVPADSSTIQAGINGAVNGDTVLVAEGHYYKRISFNGKGILVASEFVNDSDTMHIINTVIDGDTTRTPLVSDTGSVVRFVNGEDSLSILEGFTIQGGVGTLYSGTTRLGGGIYCKSSSPTVRNCVIKTNTATCGGGVFYLQSPGSPKLILCDIIGNTADSVGGGFGGQSNGIASFLGCRIMYNSAPQGGGIWCRSSYSTAILNCRVANNSDGLYCDWSGATIESSTFLNNKILGYHSGFTITGSKLDSSAVDGFSHSSLTDDTLFDSYVHAEDEHTARINKCRLLRSNITVHNANAYVDSSIIAGKIRLYGEEMPWVRVTNSTLLGDSVIDQSFGGSRAKLWNCILMTRGGPAIAGGPVTNRDSLTCCDVFGYQISWIAGTPPLLDTANVLFLDPLFCDTANGDFGIYSHSPCAPDNNNCGVLIGAKDIGCICGDANADGQVNSADVSYLINYLFVNGPAPQPMQAGDANCDGSVNSADVSYLINYLFVSGPAPCC